MELKKFEEFIDREPIFEGVEEGKNNDKIFKSVLNNASRILACDDLGKKLNGLIGKKRCLLLTSINKENFKNIRRFIEKNVAGDYTSVENKDDFDSISLFGRLYCFRKNIVVFENPEEYLFDEDNLITINQAIGQSYDERDVEPTKNAEKYLIDVTGENGFFFNGFIIMITSKSVDELSKDKKLKPHFGSLVLRAFVLDYSQYEHKETGSDEKNVKYKEEYERLKKIYQEKGDDGLKKELGITD